MRQWKLSSPVGLNQSPGVGLAACHADVLLDTTVCDHTLSRLACLEHGCAIEPESELAEAGVELLRDAVFSLTFAQVAGSRAPTLARRHKVEWVYPSCHRSGAAVLVGVGAW